MRWCVCEACTVEGTQSVLVLGVPAIAASLPLLLPCHYCFPAVSWKTSQHQEMGANIENQEMRDSFNKAMYVFSSFDILVLSEME